MCYGTDGELALEKAFEKVFPIDADQENKSIHLRCFEHVKIDMKRKMEEMKVSEKEQQNIIKTILGTEFDGKRTNGLVDSSDEDEFNRNWISIRQTLPKEFVSWVETEKGRLRSLVDTLKKCMLKPVRISAGLGNPPNKFDTQRAESFNNTIKDATKRTTIDQAEIHDIIEEKIVKAQEEECVKAICGMGEYRLSSEYKHLSIDAHQWYQQTHIHILIAHPICERS